MVRSKRKIVITFFLIGIFLSFSLFVIGYVFYLHPVLSDFEIQKIVEQDSLLYMYLTPSKHASIYKVVGYDAENNMIYEQQSDSNVILLDQLYTNYKDSITFSVYSYDKNEKDLKAKNDYEYVSKDLSFSKELEHFSLKGQDFLVTFEGVMKRDHYTLDVYYENLLLRSIPISTNQVTIPSELLNNLSGQVVLKINKDGKRVTNQFNLYANNPVVGNIRITNKEELALNIWDDVEIKYEGGGNANSLVVNLYKDGKLENSKTFSYNGHSIIIPADFFKEESQYTLELVALYNNYQEIAKKDYMEIEIGKKEPVSPVYVDYNYKNIKKGTKVSFKSNTSGADIYYTLDGSEPTEDSFLYTMPITINGDSKIKAKAIRKNMFDSVTNTFDFHIGEKPLVVYLSPSNQYENYGVKEAGYTSEMKMMNKLTDYLKPYLESFGVKVYRNRPSGDINSWLSESNYVKSDLHLAIHSNASEAHDAYGIEMYVDSPNSKSLSIANKIYNHLYQIYPYKDKGSYRGIKYSEQSLGEANDSFIPCGTLIEIAYHDNYNDAKWIVDHLEEIAHNIGDSILEFYQVK